MTAFPNIQQFFKKIFSTVNLWVSAVSTRLSLRKSWQNGRHKKNTVISPISWCRNFVERQSFHRVLGKSLLSDKISRSEN